MRRQLRDPEVRRKAWPDYTFGCKRSCSARTTCRRSQRDNVELVTDAGRRGIEPDGVRTRTAPPRGGHASSGAPASRPPSSCSPWTSSAGTGGRCRRSGRGRARPPGDDRAGLPVAVRHVRAEHQHLGRLDHRLPRGAGRATCARRSRRPLAPSARRSTSGPRSRRPSTGGSRRGSRARRGRSATPGTATSRAGSSPTGRTTWRVRAGGVPARSDRVRLHRPVAGSPRPGARNELSTGVVHTGDELHDCDYDPDPAVV